ncbi:SEC-C metal-binding domain-containing protein [Methylorubrum extorquens]|uniref:SEC-C metal-binding domain-containing protein n=1 Tax=Methylorubrum extorquens TaxID=408 RepID=UPI0020A05979|nr:SEC-C metal-binding domain-containing protein [Methylorubrum extorquens]MCP1540155.1 hypothetical protein [Methylorubrum extorquens]
MAAIAPHILDKIGTTTPPAVTAAIRSLARDLSPNFEPGFVPVRPAPSSQVSECFPNVVAKVAQSGGRILYGWAIWMWPRVFIEAEHHAVWDDGTDLVDITPHIHGEKRILFLPDPERAYDFEGQSRLLNVKRSLGEVPAAQRWIDASDQLQRFLVAHTAGAEMTFSRDEVMPLADEVQYRKAEILVALAGRTRPHEPCVCGSGRKFRKCCFPHIHLDR